MTSKQNMALWASAWGLVFAIIAAGMVWTALSVGLWLRGPFTAVAFVVITLWAIFSCVLYVQNVDDATIIE